MPAEASASSDCIEVGLISATRPYSLCPKCREPITRDLSKPDNLLGAERKTTCPHFCSSCKSWYHPKCSVRQGEGLNCPSCEKKPYLQSPSFYCETCGRATQVTVGTMWPQFTCARCGKPTSLAALQFAGGKEVGWLLLVGAACLVLFILASVFEMPYALLLVTGSLAALFSLPWILLIVGVLVSAIMPMGMDIGRGIGQWGGGVDGLLIREVAEFRLKPPAQRFGRVYLWLVATGLSGLVVAAIGLAFIYFFMEFVRNK